MDWYLNPGTHLVVIGEPGDSDAEEMHRMALVRFAPRRVVQRLTPAEAEAGRLPEAIAGMLAAATGTRGYACVGTSCSLPVATAEGWDQLLRREAQCHPERSEGSTVRARSLASLGMTGTPLP